MTETELPDWLDGHAGQESGLSRQEILAVLSNMDDALRSDWTHEAFNETLDGWQSQKPEKLTQLETSDEFNWRNARWEFATTGANTSDTLPEDVNLITGLSDESRDEHPELAETARNFVADWFTYLCLNIAAKQHYSTLSEREFIVHLLDATLLDKQIASAMTELTGTNQERGTISSQKMRARSKINDAGHTFKIRWRDHYFDIQPPKTTQTFEVETDSQFRGTAERNPYQLECEYIVDTGAGKLFISREFSYLDSCIATRRDTFDLSDDTPPTVEGDHREIEQWCQDDFEARAESLVEQGQKIRQQESEVTTA